MDSTTNLQPASRPKAGRQSARGLGLAAALLLGAGLSLGAATAPRPFELVAEMELPPSVHFGKRAELPALEEAVGADEGLERLAAEARRLWPLVREVDFVELSRSQREATAGWRPPLLPAPFHQRVVGRDDGGRLHLELRGPRLPAAYDIVHRYLHLYGRYDPRTGRLDRLVVTIRGWVLE